MESLFVVRSLLGSIICSGSPSCAGLQVVTQTTTYILYNFIEAPIPKTSVKPTICFWFPVPGWITGAFQYTRKVLIITFYRSASNHAPSFNFVELLENFFSITSLTAKHTCIYKALRLLQEIPSTCVTYIWYGHW